MRKRAPQTSNRNRQRRSAHKPIRRRNRNGWQRPRHQHHIINNNRRQSTTGTRTIQLNRRTNPHRQTKRHHVLMPQTIIKQRNKLQRPSNTNIYIRPLPRTRHSKRRLSPKRRSQNRPQGNATNYLRNQSFQLQTTIRVARHRTTNHNSRTSSRSTN